jgi:phage terminase Nu1 subunit (DNA packaging protein)
VAKTISQQVAAAILGVSDRRVRQILQEGGGPTQAASGALDAREFGLWLERRVLEQHGVTEDGEALDLSAERARLARAQADKTELELAELRGEHVRITDVTDAWSQHIAAVRAKLLALPSKAAPQVSPLGIGGGDAGVAAGHCR